MKKTISLVAALVMLCTSIFSNTVFAAFSDVDDKNQYSKAITTMSKLGVINGYEDGSFKPDGSITRAEFTKIIVVTLGLGDLQTEPKEFDDVSSHWGKYYIKTAYDQGIINGFGDGSFRPDETVTYEQALKMIVCTLGYKSFADAAGGYPGGYISQANQLDLTKNITGLAYDAPASRGAITQAVYNALEVEMKKLDNNNTWVNANKNLLNDYLGYRKLKGELTGVEDFVTGNCQGSLLKGQMQVVSSINPEDYVNMDYTQYTSDMAEISKNLGRNVVVYYKQKNSNDEPVLAVVDDETSKNTEYKIKAENIVSFDNSSIKYYEDGTNASKSVKFKLDDLTVRYNGKVVDKKEGTKLRNKSYTSASNKFTDVYSFKDALNAWLNPDSEYFIYGDIVLTDRDSDNSIDDIQINDYQTIVALRSPSSTDYKITDKIVTGNSLTLNPDSTKYSFSIVKDGKQIATTSIAANDVVLYAESIDESLYAALVSNTKVTGNITSVSGDDVEINNVTYKLGASCAKYISDKQNGKQITTGQTGTFYVDKYNTLVFGEIAEEKEKPYAYISNVYAEDGTENYYIVAFCPSKSTSGAANYQLKDKVTFNGKSMSASAVADALRASAANSNADVNDSALRSKIYGSKASSYDPSSAAYEYSQLARIDINSSGQVSSIVTVDDEEASSNENTSKVVRCKGLASYNYASNSFTLKNQTQFSINSSTTIIYVPATRSRTEFAKKSTSTFSSNESYYVEAYDVSSSRYANIVLIYGTSGSKTGITRTTGYSIVTKKTTPFYNTATDETTEKITVFGSASGAERDYTTSTDDEFTSLEIGDVIQFGLDQDGYAEDRRNCISFSDISEVLDGAVGSSGALYDWSVEQTPEEDNNWQEFKFDYRFKKSGTSTEETYTSSTFGTVPYSRAAMFNVIQVLDEDNRIHVTKGGFNSDGTLVDEDEYEELIVSPSTKIIRMEDDRKSISPYAEDTTTNMTFTDLKGAKDYGLDCSKILVITSTGTVRLIVVYN